MTHEYAILLVEDDPNLGIILREALEMQGFRVKLCTDGEAGAEAARKETFDLCLIDVMLPKKDGFSLAEEIRRRDAATPIIFLTAKSMKEDRIRGLRIGADDYITKPFSMEELVLRIRAVLRRSGSGTETAPEEGLIALGAYSFDYANQRLFFGDESNQLTYKESELLRLLCLYRNRILDRDTALTRVWGETGFFPGRSMDVYISKLRKYLKEDPCIEIKTVHGQGFKLMVKET